MPKGDGLKIALFCGGVGTRAWPMSRKALPKQFQPLVGDTSMFQQTSERLIKAFSPENIFVITGKDYISTIHKQAPKIPLKNIIGEVEMRDTYAAVGMAVAMIDKLFPDSTMAVIWAADHLIKNDDEFINVLKVAQDVAEKDPVMVNIDVRPTFPNIHLGYTKIGKVVDSVDGYEVYEWLQHVEKPDYKTAKKFFQSFNHLFHTGYFVWKTSTALRFLEKYDPETSKIVREIQQILGTKDEQAQLAKLYSKIKKISIDYGLFEKLQPGDGRVIPGELGWADVGSWDQLLEELLNGEAESGANVTKGEVIALDTKRSLIYSSKDKIIATIGLEDMIVVDTPDALLICPRNRTQDVKKIVEKLKEEKKDKYL